jgi:hypothetical protein
MAMTGPGELFVRNASHMEYWVLPQIGGARQTSMEYLMGPDDGGGRAGE